MAIGIQVSNAQAANARDLLNRLSKSGLTDQLAFYGQLGVLALSSATPQDTGTTARSWDYVIKSGRSSSTLAWVNTNTNGGVNIAVILQYGHGTGTGGWVEGIDYINPAIQPVFKWILEDIRKKVSGG